MVGLHEIDERKSRAYELSVYADKAVAGGDIARARDLMAQAAELDGTYAVRAALVGSVDQRKVRLAPTIRRLLLPGIFAAGFSTHPEGPWKEGVYLERQRGDFTHSLLIGRSKFGGRLGVDAVRRTGPADVQRFDWHRLNMRSGDLAFRTQEEVEAVCIRWREIIELEVVPWLETGAYRNRQEGEQ